MDNHRRERHFLWREFALLSHAALCLVRTLTRMRVAERRRLRTAVAPPTVILVPTAVFPAAGSSFQFKHRGKDLCRGKC